MVRKWLLAGLSLLLLLCLGVTWVLLDSREINHDPVCTARVINGQAC